MVGQPIIDKPACASALEPATTHTDAYELVFHTNDAAEHGVQSTWGRRRVFLAVSWLEAWSRESGVLSSEAANASRWALKVAIRSHGNTILPHDPDGYLERLKRLIGHPLDDIALSYVREGLLTFLGGHYFSATVMLGVASEQCIDLLIEAYTNAIADTNRKTAFVKKIEQAGRSVKDRFDKLRNELLALKLPPTLMDALDIQLSGIFTLIRYSRNDAGHPTGQVVDRDMAHGNLLLFPQYCKRVYDLIEYFRMHPA